MSRDKYSRRSPVLPIRDKVLIMCGGQTEAIYFNYYKNKHKKDLANISIKVLTHKKSNPFADFDKAIILASENGVSCAFSNEAIEYWFLLHYENKTGAISRNALNTELGNKLDFEYDKGAETIQRTCLKINNKLLAAEERAQVGHERHIINSGEKPSNWCSCTTMYALTKRLREWSKAKK